MIIKYLYTLANLKKNIKSYQILDNKIVQNKSYNRIYHHHLMKTGGTSINSMFLNLSNNSDLMNKLMREKDLRIISNDRVYCAHHQLLIALGFFHYAWSHRPIYKTMIPSKTFVFTCFRNPYKRVYSRYKQLMIDYNDGSPLRNDFKSEYKLLGNNFSEYLKNIPQKELCHQLYMYSKKLDVDEGLNRLLKVNYIIDLKNFNHDIAEINKILGINLLPIHKRKTRNEDNLDILKCFNVVSEKIKPELEFYHKALELKQSLK